MRWQLLLAALALGAVLGALGLAGALNKFSHHQVTVVPPCYAHVQGFHLPTGAHWC